MTVSHSNLSPPLLFLWHRNCSQSGTETTDSIPTFVHIKVGRLPLSDHKRQPWKPKTWLHHNLQLTQLSPTNSPYLTGKISSFHGNKTEQEKERDERQRTGWMLGVWRHRNKKNMFCFGYGNYADLRWKWGKRKVEKGNRKAAWRCFVLCMCHIQHQQRLN